ncbi:MAG: hypothetical protein Q8P29_03230 [Candidatus Levybacteria bacterium]|nr:hypothetical protein [Candidatus Levybacteria bacterium]
MDFINFLHPTLLIKILTLIVIVFYAIFTFVVFTQVKTMSRILHFPAAKRILKTISIIHISLAISLFLLAIVIL